MLSEHDSALNEQLNNRVHFSTGNTPISISDAKQLLTHTHTHTHNNNNNYSNTSNSNSNTSPLMAACPIDKEAMDKVRKVLGLDDRKMAALIRFARHTHRQVGDVGNPPFPLYSTLYPKLLYSILTPFLY